MESACMYSKNNFVLENFTVIIYVDKNIYNNIFLH